MPRDGKEQRDVLPAAARSARHIQQKRYRRALHGTDTGGEEKLFTDTGGKGYWPLRGLVERQYGEERERERTINKQWSRTITRRMFYMYLNR